MDLIKTGYGSSDTVTKGKGCYVPSPITTAQFQTFFSGGNQYQVTAGKVFYVTHVIVTAGAANGGVTSIGYGDTGVNNSAAAPTNAVTVCGALLIATATNSVPFDVFLVIPASKFPYVVATGANPSVILCGLEI